MTLFVWLAGLALLSGPTVANTPFDHSAWDRVLKAHVNPSGEVDYRAIKADRKDLDRYSGQLGGASPENHPELFPARADQFAYWINAYNAFVTRGVADRYPTHSVRDLGPLLGFFRREEYIAGGRKMSLSSLENVILRKKFADPRVHFSIVCASLGCPMLAREAFTGVNLEQLLDRQARRFINQRRNVKVDAATNTVRLSKIFDWYTVDFVGSKGKQALVDYIRRYASPETRRALDALKQPRIRFYDYDWSINDPGSRSRSSNPLEREAGRVSQ
ncbi:MAG: hypothetical protein DMG57_15540 [Acidobacteria bacterium]|nr:MAG: hypothetical protein DMG57_15540 [Acidobacteriota bacterium]